MKNKIGYILKSSSFHSRVVEALSILEKKKEANNRIDFDNLMEELLPEVKQYIIRQLKISLKKGTLPEGKYKVEDFTDELYIQAYDNIHELAKSGSMHNWLFRKADGILEDVIIEEDFNNMFFKNLNEYTKEEEEAMEEIFTRDADGDLIMLEEIDDLSYSKLDYTLEETFINHIEKDLIEKLNRSMTKKEIYRQIDTILFCLPFKMRTIFELSIYHNFKSSEISEIKKIHIQEVDAILAQAKNVFSRFYFNRLV